MTRCRRRPGHSRSWEARCRRIRSSSIGCERRARSFSGKRISPNGLTSAVSLPSTAGARGGVLPAIPIAWISIHAGRALVRGAAPAANLCAAAVGTETDGSVVCPSGNNLVVGLKPTVGLVAQDGIIPIAHSQDTAGPMCRTVTDVAIMLGVMQSPFGEVIGHNLPRDYTSFFAVARSRARGSGSTTAISRRLSAERMTCHRCSQTGLAHDGGSWGDVGNHRYGRFERLLRCGVHCPAL